MMFDASAFHGLQSFAPYAPFASPGPQWGPGIPGGALLPQIAGMAPTALGIPPGHPAYGQPLGQLFTGGLGQQHACLASQGLTGMLPFGQPGQFGQPFGQFSQAGLFGQPFGQFGQASGQLGQPFGPLGQAFAQPGPLGQPFGQPTAGWPGIPLPNPFGVPGAYGAPSGPYGPATGLIGGWPGQLPLLAQLAAAIGRGPLSYPYPAVQPLPQMAYGG